MCYIYLFRSKLCILVIQYVHEYASVFGYYWIININDWRLDICFITQLSTRVNKQIDTNTNNCKNVREIHTKVKLEAITETYFPHVLQLTFKFRQNRNVDLRNGLVVFCETLTSGLIYVHLFTSK